MLSNIHQEAVIVFVSHKYGTDNIFIMNADGSGVKRITYGKSNDRYPTWR